VFLADYRDYVVPVTFDKNVMSIRDRAYPVTSMPPEKDGRFHRENQSAFYFASGITGALAERYGTADANLSESDAAFNAPIGTHYLFDMGAYLEDHADDRTKYFPGGDRGGWAACQSLRDFMEESNVSGTTYPNQKHAGGINVAVWPLPGRQFDSLYFSRVDSRTLKQE